VIYEAFRCKKRPPDCDSEWRVEAVDHESEGECYTAIFIGYDARERAQEYAAMRNTATGTAGPTK
jgi:hypothetical protein